jgi:GNAT superfamily N-acetyltransferase
MIRRLQPDDLSAALKLTQAEQWSHRLEDWQFHHRMGRGWAVCDEESGELIGTASWWAYGEAFGSVGLVLVDRRQQGKGIGRRLMNLIIDEAGSRVLQLVATKAGLKLYQQCGFREVGGIEQRQGVAAPQLSTPTPSGVTLRPTTPGDLAALCELDAAALGAARPDVIGAVAAAGAGVAAERDGHLTGFAAIRQSGRGALIGPVVAPDEALAIALIEHLLRATSGFTRVDTASEATQLATWLEAAGLVRVDEVTVMVRGARPESRSGVRTFGLVSQALG